MPTRYVTDQIEADGDAGEDHRAEDHGQHHESRTIAVSGILRRLVGAGIVEIDVLLQDRIGLEPDLVDRLGVQFMGLLGKLARRLAGQRHDLFGSLLVAFPQLDPFVVKRALFLRSDHRLVGGADLGVALDDGSERLFVRQLVRQRFGQHVLADHVAIGDDPGAQVAQHADARQPARRDLHRVGVDGAHVPDREQAHTRHCDEQECHDGDDLGADGVFGEHDGNLLVLGARERRT